MPLQLWPYGRRRLQLLLALLPVLFLFASYILKASYKDTFSDTSHANTVRRGGFISFRAWNDTSPGPGDKWYAEDGTPLSYAAWRVKDGPLSPEPTARATLMQYGARVACWPSTGGVWIKHAVPLELDFLGLDRFRDTQRPWPQNAKKEDAFCAKMRMIGSEFWRLPPGLPDLSCSPLEKCVKPQRRGDLGLAWLPEGGVCAVNLTSARAEWGVGLRGYYNAGSMDWRCDISQALGGDLCYEEPEKCEAMWCSQYPDNCHEATRLFCEHPLCF